MSAAAGLIDLTSSYVSIWYVRQKKTNADSEAMIN